MTNEHTIAISIIIPVYNEEHAVRGVIEKLKKELSRHHFFYEIIAVNDGSSDGSGKILKDMEGIQYLAHPYNKGYGASLKTGAFVAKYDWLVFYDADGQHRPEYIPELIRSVDSYAMVVGSRRAYKGPIIRQPGKFILGKLANYLVDFKIPDLNSGLRLVRKDLFARFVHLYPNGFSLSTTITMAFLKSGLDVKYIPIDIENRAGGQSAVKPKHALQTLLLMVRIITLFAPMRFFFPVTFFVFLFAFVSFMYDILKFNLTDTTVALFLSSLFTLFFGVLLDHVAAIRRELHN
jgi:glycosyltransferase involved in cell wall biosynthesis